MFSITCVTCQARIAVRSEGAIGLILGCPRCGGMVEVLPPEGWKSPSEPPPVPGTPAEPAAAVEPGLSWYSTAELRWRKWLLLGAAPVAGLVVMLGAWSVFSSSGFRELPPEQVAEQTVEPAIVEPPPTAPAEPTSPSDESDRRDSAAATTDASVQPVAEDADPRVPGEPETNAGSEETAAAALSERGDPPYPKPQEPAPQDAEPVAKEPGEEPPKPNTDGDESSQDEPAGRRAAVEPIDVEARLAEVVPRIELRRTPLGEAIALLSAVAAAPISFDPRAIEQLGVSPRDPVTLDLAQTSVGKILEAAVGGRGLEAVIENGVVLLTLPPRQRNELRPVRYTVADLTLGNAAAMDRLAHLVRTLVAPNSWSTAGGPGTLKTDGGVLLVTQTGVVHDQVLVFCEKLRVARGKPLRSRGDPDRFKLTTRRGRAAAVLDRPVAANFHEPAPLSDILSHLARMVDTDVLIDHAALRAEGLTAAAPATLKVERQPMAVALEKLLTPLGLAASALDARLLHVSTRTAVDARLELEFYPLGKLLSGGTRADALIERITHRVADTTWSEVGGPGVLAFDAPSKCLIVLQSQPVHVAIERLLAEQAGKSRR